MYSCLVVSHPENAKKYKKIQNILGDSLKDYPFQRRQFDYEDHILIYDTTFTLVWQTVLNLECSGFPVSYGFGDSEIIATENAIANWKKRKILTNSI